MSQNDCRFYPVQCSENKLRTLTPQDGYVYFTTDSKKIYLGRNNKLVSMNETTGIFYGFKEIKYDNSGILPDPSVTFFSDEIEGIEIPEIDDLILNVGTNDLPDGCFYRVKSLDRNKINTVRLTLQGTGGGGGSSGPSVGGGSYGLALISPSRNGTLAVSSEATEIPITFICDYDGEKENYIAELSFTLEGQTVPFYIHDKTLEMNIEHTIDLIKYKDLFQRYSNADIVIKTVDKYGNSRDAYFSVNIVTLSLIAGKNPILTSRLPSCIFNYNITGGVGSAINKREMVYTIYAEDNTMAQPLTIKVDIGTTKEGNVQDTLDLSLLKHGTYILTAQAIATISGGKIIPSNILTHKLIYFIDENSIPLLAVLPPEVTEQYTEFEVPYLVASSEDDVDNYTLVISIDDEEHDKLTVVANQLGTCKFYFEDIGRYNITFTVLEIAQSYSTTFNIVKYTGEIPTINVDRADLMLYLNPRGNSNDSVDRNKWWDHKKKYVAQLNNLYYGTTNGWLTDKNQAPFLRMSSGATLSLPDFFPFARDLTQYDINGATPGYGFTIELDIAMSGILNYEADIIKCVSTNKDDEIRCGFTITGNKIYFFSDKQNTKEKPLTVMDLAEEERVRLSFVVEPNAKGTENNFPMIYTYLNGIISSIVSYGETASFKDSSDNPATLMINSENATIDIYGIRFYSTALTDGDILNNFTASLPSLKEREIKYKDNLVLDPITNKVSLSKVEAMSETLQIPYMLITGGVSCDKKFKVDSVNEQTPGLPTGKKTYKLIDCEVKYPKTALFNGYTDYSCKCEFESGNPLQQAFGETPIRGAMMYAQGTSSMEYPTKNLRIKFKNEEDYIQVKPNLPPVEIICMKADFMESSGSHNTGAANLVDQLYKYMEIATPGQKHFENEDYDTVTAIKGYPCLIFFSQSGDPNSYEFIGKYNLNLDKATPEPFGFRNDDNDEDFGYLHDKDGNLVLTDKGEKINSIHCFEFLDNAVKVCNFLPMEGMTYYDTWYQPYTNKDGDVVPGWCRGFESRYPEDRVGSTDADSLQPLAFWINELKTLYDEEIAAGKKPTDKTYIYKYDLVNSADYVGFVEYFILNEDGSYSPADVSAENYEPGKYYSRTVENSRFVMDSLERFKREYQCYLDKDFTLTYYLLTEALLMADSRVKNMMIATWGPEKRTYKNINDEEKESFNYIFYPIFYDMDTMLGLNNFGEVAFKYFTQDIDSEDIYNGDEVLWVFVREALSEDLAIYYSQLEDKIFTAGKILPYFSENQANLPNEAFYNADAKYKYVRPFITGYLDDSKKDGEEGRVVDPGEAKFMYAAQGSRDIMRKNFITNRMKFLSGKYHSKNFTNNDRLEFRFNSPSSTSTDEDLKQSVQYVPADGNFAFTGLRTGYAGIMVGANGNVVGMRVEPNKTIPFSEDVSSAAGTEAYILGISNLSDMGDLSTKYLQKFIFKADNIRLEKLKLGNSHKYYNNTYWKADSSIALTGCTYLKEFNLQNCPTFGGMLDFSKCLAIEQILLTGSGTTSVVLPPNSVVNELRLPVSVNDLVLDNCLQLQPNKFSIGGYDYGDKMHIGDEGTNYLNDFTKLNKVKIINTNVDSYSMVRVADNLEEYCLQDINWDLTDNDIQYRRIGKVANNEDNIVYYYYDNEDKQYKLYDGNYPSEINLYTKHILVNSEGIIDNIPILEFLQGKSTYDGIPQSQAITGTITIDVEGKANEFELYKKYYSIYPNLTIKYGSKVNLEEAYNIKFYHQLDANKMADIDINVTKPRYTVITDGTQILADLISKEGPMGFDMPLPVKPSTNTYNYFFSGKWYDWTDPNKTVYYQDYAYEVVPNDSNFPELGQTYYIYKDYQYVEYEREEYPYDGFAYKRVIPETSFLKFKPTTDMALVPEFIEAKRTYYVGFYENDVELFYTNLGYEDNVGQGTRGNAGIEYQYKPDRNNELKENERFTFKGWFSEEDYQSGTTNPTLLNLDEITVTKDMKFYARFVIEDATTTPSDSKLFNIQQKNYSVNGQVINDYGIELKDMFVQSIGGKITLPSYDASGNALKIINNFKGIRAENNVEIYFLEDARYEVIADETFMYSSIKNEEQDYINEYSIKKIYLPNTLKTIGTQAFKQTMLSDLDLPNGIITIGEKAFYESPVENIKLPDSITVIGNRAFNGAQNLKLSTLPSGLTTLGVGSFAGCSNITISELPLGIQRIPFQCFALCPNIAITNFGSVEIEESAFDHSCTQPNITRINLSKVLGIGGVIFDGAYTKLTDIEVPNDLFGYEDESALTMALFGSARNITYSKMT